MAFFSTLRKDLYAAFFEFLGTVFFLLLGFGGIQAVAYSTRQTTVSPVLQVFVISTSMGLSLLAAAWVFFRITGALFNPDVTLALWIVGNIGFLRFVLYCVAEMTGAIAASGLILALTPGPLASNTFLGNRVNSAEGVFMEMFITAALVFSVLVLGSGKSSTARFAPVGIGLTYFVCHLFALPYTGASMSTARSFGPAAVTGFPDSHQWIYWLGPLLGSLLASVFYLGLAECCYWTINPERATDDLSQGPARMTSAGDGPRAGTGDGGGTTVPARATGTGNAGIGEPSMGGTRI